MNRRTFLKTNLLLYTAGTFKSNSDPEGQTHVLTFSFDDGFKKSFFKIAEIYEEFGLQACLNVIASGHLPEFKQVDNWILPELMGNFDDWNNLASRGHEIMPHSWKHLNLAKQPHEKSIDLIDQCLDFFQKNLVGYQNKKAVFNFPFNASTPALESYLLNKVRAVRAWGHAPINAIPISTVPRSLGCASRGPNNIDQWVKNQIDAFLDAPGGWLILNLHGLDGEGWGPISSHFLKKTLQDLSQIQSLEILPTGKVLDRISG